MSISGDFNFRTPHPDVAPRLDATGGDSTLEQIRESVEQVRNHLLRSQRRIERNEQHYRSLALYVWALWAILGVVIPGCGLLVWYELPVLKEQRAQMASQTAIRNYLLQESGKLATPNVPTPVQTIPSTPAEVSVVKPAISPVTREKTVAAVARPDAEIPWDNVLRQRIDFQLENNKTVQVATGIYLTIKDSDVNHQQVNGWLQLANDGRIVFIRDQGAKKSLSFVARDDSHPSYLIFTRVDSQGVAGYLLRAT